MKYETGNIVYLKGAFEMNGKIALLTSTNIKEELNRPIQTLDGTYYVGHYRMSAPFQFWKELFNRIKN